MSISNRIIQLNMKRGKSPYRLLYLILCIIVMLFVFVTAFFESAGKTNDYRQQQLYGSWHFAAYRSDEHVQQRLANHATVEQTGQMKVYGRVMEQNNFVGNLGTVDSTVIQLGNFALRAGAFPVLPGDIAVEQGILEELGYSINDIGKEIVLSVQLASQSDRDALVIQKSFRLTGVVVNYSELWKAPADTLVSFFVSALQESQTPLYTNVFCQIKDRYLENTKELYSITDGHCAGIKNDSASSVLSDSVSAVQKNLNADNGVMHLIVLVVSAFIIFIVLTDLLRERNSSFTLMRSIGSTEGQIIQLYIRSVAFVTFFAAVSGIAAGGALSWLIWWIADSLSEQQLYFSLGILSLLTDCLYLILSVLLAGALSILYFFNLSFEPASAYHMCINDCFHRKKVNRPLTGIRIVKAFNQAHRSGTVFALLVMCCTCTALAGTAFYGYERLQSAQSMRNAYPMDYEFSFYQQGDTRIKHMDTQELELLQGTYGVEKIRTYQYRDRLALAWSGMEQSPYITSLKHNRVYDGKEIAYPVGNIFSIVGTAEEIRYFDSELDSGQLPEEAFLRGDAVLLYLPVFTMNDQQEPVVKHSYYNIGYTGIEEDTISVGAPITLSGYYGVRNVAVAGIITSFKHENPFSFLNQPYTVIGSTALYSQLYGENAASMAEYVQVFGEPGANLRQTDQEMSDFSSDLTLRNFRLEKIDVFIQVYFCLFIVALLDMVLLMSFILIWRGGTALSIDSMRRRLHTLYTLGMKKQQLFFIHIYNTAVFSVIANFAALTAVLTICILPGFINSTIRSLGVSGFLEFCSLTIQQFFCIVPWPVILLFASVFSGINLCVIMIPFFTELHGFTRKNK